MSQHEITEFDLFFLSYDEPNAEKHWADLLDKAPWAKRVHGVKGFAAAHMACADQSETPWFVTVDADNIVRPEFFNISVELDADRRPRECLSWNGLNMINGLQYGNGGLKLWSREFVKSGGVGHEVSIDPMHAVDFCWQEDYRQVHETYSDVWNNGSPYQAFRVGFREGVKLTLDRGMRVPANEMKTRLHPMNLRNIRIWSSVGADVNHGYWAMLGARLGWNQMLDPNFDHTLVRDFDWFDAMWKRVKADTEDSPEWVCENIGYDIEKATGIKCPILLEDVSKFFRETFALRNE